MRKSVRNKMSMYQGVHNIVKEFQTEWEGTPKFVSTFNAFSAKLALIKVHAEKQRSYAVGVKQARDANRKKTAELGIRIASALTAFAADSKNLELIALMRITESQLTKRTHSETIILLDRIRIYAEENLSALQEYGITEEIFATFLAFRDDLVVNILAPRMAIVSRKDSTAKIKELSVEIDELLSTKLDKMVKVVASKEGSFFKRYFDIRTILDLGYRSKPDNSDSGKGPKGYLE